MREWADVALEVGHLSLYIAAGRLLAYALVPLTLSACSGGSAVSSDRASTSVRAVFAPPSPASSFSLPLLPAAGADPLAVAADVRHCRTISGPSSSTATSHGSLSSAAGSSPSRPAAAGQYISLTFLSLFSPFFSHFPRISLHFSLSIFCLSFLSLISVSFLSHRDGQSEMGTLAGMLICADNLCQLPVQFAKKVLLSHFSHFLSRFYRACDLFRCPLLVIDGPTFLRDCLCVAGAAVEELDGVGASYRTDGGLPAGAAHRTLPLLVRLSRPGASTLRHLSLARDLSLSLARATSALAAVTQNA